MNACDDLADGASECVCECEGDGASDLGDVRVSEERVLLDGLALPSIDSGRLIRKKGREGGGWMGLGE